MTDKIHLDHTAFWTMESQHMGYTYDVRVSLPTQEPPETGFPVYYVLDGNSYFQFGRDIVKLQSRNTPKTLIAPAIVVGIGHHGSNVEVSKRRFYDFTPPAEHYVYPDRLKGFDVGEHGGAKKLIAFLEQELIPEIEGKYNVNRTKRAIFGHSLSGMFVLWTLFTRSELFQYYLASSPSIWWNDHEIMRIVEACYQQNEGPTEDTKLLITVGSQETFMVEDANQLYSFMSTNTLEQLSVELYIAPDENHASVVPTIMSRAFRVVNK